MKPRKRTPPFPKSLLDEQIEKMNMIDLMPQKQESYEDKGTLLEWKGPPFVLVPNMGYVKSQMYDFINARLQQERILQLIQEGKMPPVGDFNNVREAH